MNEPPLLPARARFLGAPCVPGSPGCVNGELAPCDVDVLDGPYYVPDEWPKRPDGSDVACLVCGSRHLCMTVEGLPGDGFQATCLCRLRFYPGDDDAKESAKVLTNEGA